MFKDKREYRALFFRCPGIRSASEVGNLLPSDAVREELAPKWGDVDIVHRAYLSRVNFTNFEDDALRRVGSLFVYDMYNACFPTSEGNVLMIAFPFLRMGREVFDAIRLRKRARGLVYKKLNVPSLFGRLSTKKYIGGPVRVAQAEILHLGDVDVAKVVLIGSDILNSETYRALTQAFGAKRGLQPKRCQLTYLDEEGGASFRIQADSVGNFLFRVRAGAGNLPMLHKLVQFLQDAKVMEDTSANPLARASDDNRELGRD